MSDREEWQVARRKKGAGRRGKTPHPACVDLQHTETLNTDRTKKRITETMSELRHSDIWLEWKERLTGLLSWNSAGYPGVGPEEGVARSDGGGETRPELDCVCYGLGSFSTCVSARYQLAMLLLLLDMLQIPLAACSVYDPVFSAGEREVLGDLGLTMLTVNEEGRRQVTKPTLFYLMHCGKALYNNLLWKNWRRDSLPLLALIGNSFSGIQERMVTREFQRDYSYISQVVGVVEERPLPCSSRFLDVFNDTALITFPPSSLEELPKCTWEDPAEPLYQHCSDLEIIQNQNQDCDSGVQAR